MVTLDAAHDAPNLNRRVSGDRSRTWIASRIVENEATQGEECNGVRRATKTTSALGDSPVSRAGGRPFGTWPDGCFWNAAWRRAVMRVLRPRIVLAWLILCASLPMSWTTARAGDNAPRVAVRVNPAPASDVVATQSSTPTPSAAPSETNQPPELSVNPDAGPPGTAILVTGRGFTPGVAATIDYIDVKGLPILLATVRVEADGTLPQSTLAIPPTASPGGIGQVISRDTSTRTASTVFGVTPLDRALTLNPGAISPGAVLEVSGSGFVPGSSMVLVLTDASGVTIAQTQPFSATVSGGVLPVGISIPATASPGMAVVNAVDNAGNVAGAPLLIVPALAAGQAGPVLQLLPPIATLGESVQISASGFQPGEPIQVLLGDAGGAVTVINTDQTPFADASGHFTTTFTVPIDDQTAGNPPSGRAPGSGGNAGTLLTVVARGTNSNITVRAPLLVSGTRLTIIPGTAVAGQPITVIGTGYHANETVTVTTVDPSGTISQLGSGQVSSGGVFSISVAAPAPTIAVGSTTLSVTATGESSGLVASSRVVTIAAAAISLSPWVVARGQRLVVIGTSFSANVKVQIVVNAGGDTRSSNRQQAPQRFNTATDSAGGFAITVTIPTTSTIGPRTVLAVDANGKTASRILTVYDRPPAIHVSAISASAGAAITVSGSGFASGEAVELFLALPAKKPAPLPTTLSQATADANGSFVASYVPPKYQTAGGTTEFSPGAYLFGALGLLSMRQGLTAFEIAPASQSTPGPTPVASPTAATTGCGTGNGGGTESKTSSVVAYFAAGSTAAITSNSRSNVIPGDTLQVLNTGDTPARITVAYLVASNAKATSNVVRSYTFSVQAHGVVERSVNADIGVGKMFSIIIRAETSQSCSGSNGRAPSCVGLLSDCGANIRVALVSRRDATVQDAGCRPTALSGCASRTGAQAKNAVRTLDAASTEGVSSTEGGSGALKGMRDGPSNVWYFADGHTGTAYKEYLNLLDPETVPAQVNIKFITDSGPAPAPLAVTLNPFERSSFDVSAAYMKAAGCPAHDRVPRTNISRLCTAIRAGVSVSLVITSTSAIVAERALYWGAGIGSAKAGYDVASGALSANTIARFAYVSTLHGDQAQLSILNPPQPAAVCGRKAGACDASLSVDVYSSGGIRVGTTKLRVATSKRATVLLSRFVDGGIYAISLRSTQPVVAEMAQFFGGPPSSGFHPGLESSGTSGGTILSGGGYESRSGNILVRVFNPTAGRMVVRVLGLSSYGPFYAQNYQIAANASLEFVLPPPPSSQDRSALTKNVPIALSVTCSGPCIAAGIEGARASAPAAASAQPVEVWGGTLN
jgi:hypothetical protein